MITKLVWRAAKAGNHYIEFDASEGSVNIEHLGTGQWKYQEKEGLFVMIEAEVDDEDNPPPVPPLQFDSFEQLSEYFLPSQTGNQEARFYNLGPLALTKELERATLRNDPNFQKVGPRDVMDQGLLICIYLHRRATGTWTLGAKQVVDEHPAMFSDFEALGKHFFREDFTE